MSFLLISLLSISLYAQSYETLSCMASSNNKEEFLGLVTDAKKLESFLGHKISTQFDIRCDLSSIENKKEYIIAFDGTGGFSPIEFETNRLEKKLKRIDSTKSLELPINQMSSKIGQHTFINKNKKMYSALKYLLKIQSDEMKTNQEFIYFSHTHMAMGTKCIKKIKKINPNIKIKVIGYSWGGNTAQKVMNKLNRQSINIESVLLLDPVRKGFMGTGVIKNLTSLKNSNFFKKTPNVKKLYAVYQKTDIKSFGVISVRGNPAKGADVNVDLSNNCIDDNHLYLGRCKQTLELYQKFLND